MKPISVRHRLVPKVEALEERCVPSGVSVKQTGATLAIIGTNQADNISINDDGKHIRVFVGGVKRGTFANVDTLQINTLGGADNVTYNAAGTPLANLDTAKNIAISRALYVNLGAGNDIFSANVVQSLTLPSVPPVISNLGSQSDLNIHVAGGDGNDTSKLSTHDVGSQANLQFRFDGGIGNDTYFVSSVQDAPGSPTFNLGSTVGYTFLGGKGNDFAEVGMNGDLTVNALVNVNLQGQDGNDTFIEVLQSALDGQLNILQNGGAGNDTLFNQLAISQGSTFGSLNFQALGDIGDDKITGSVHSAAGNSSPITALIDGGPGNDIGEHTATVTTSNFESLTLLP